MNNNDITRGEKIIKNKKQNLKIGRRRGHGSASARRKRRKRVCRLGRVIQYLYARVINRYTIIIIIIMLRVREYNVKIIWRCVVVVRVYVYAEREKNRVNGIGKKNKNTLRAATFSDDV